MTAIMYSDTTQKNSLPPKYNQDGYRMLADNTSEHKNMPSWFKPPPPPPFYTDPNLTPFTAQTQLLQGRNTNPNVPRGMVKMNNVEKEESRWWDWSGTKVERNEPVVRNRDESAKKQESSYQNIFGCWTESVPQPKKNTRYSATPQYIRAVGIVPITDLKHDGFQPMNNTNLEKRSYEPQYENYQTANNLREQRHNGLVNEEAKPSIKPFDRSQANGSAKVERTPSMWDLFHPNDDTRGQVPTNAMKYRRPLPQIKQTEQYGNVWQNAPYASDHQVDQSLYKPSMIKHAYAD